MNAPTKVVAVASQGQITTHISNANHALLYHSYARTRRKGHLYLTPGVRAPRVRLCVVEGRVELVVTPSLYLTLSPLYPQVMNAPTKVVAVASQGQIYRDDSGAEKGLLMRGLHQLCVGSRGTLVPLSVLPMEVTYCFIHRRFIIQRVHEHTRTGN